MKGRLVAGLLLAGLLVGGCSWMDAINPFASKGPKMAELKPFTASTSMRVMWRESTGRSDLYAFTPAVVGNSVYAAGGDGSVLRIDDGKIVWKIDAGVPLSAGVGTDGKLVSVGTPKGDLLVFTAEDGKLAWKAKASSEILAPPAVAEGLIVVRSGDNRLAAYDTADGTRKWVFQRPAPALSLRATAPPVIDGSYVFVGLPGGKLVALSVNNGVAVWEGTVASPKGTTELERVADITSVPVIVNGTVCAAAFQGRVACFDLGNGNLIWARDMSSSAGLSVDSRYVFVTDDKGAVHALNSTNGASFWKQDALNLRRVTAPLPVGSRVAVADAEGVVHLLNREDGAFAARLNTDGSPVFVAPQRIDGGFVVQTSKGGVYAIGTE